MVFEIEHLHRLREYEMLSVAKELPRGSVILEIGAGTGFQSRILSDLGFDVVAIDLAESSYAPTRVYPILDYDGRTLPVESHSIDIVFSSNVLEHVVDLPRLQSEIRRVLKPGGFCLHLMPSPSWRFWTIISGWFDLVPAIIAWLQTGPQRLGSKPLVRLAKDIVGRIVPLRHGETGTALSELWTFGRRHWCQQFVQEGFKVEIARPAGIFYTGFMLFGRRMTIDQRRVLARWLGSACNLYRVRPDIATSTPAIQVHQ